MKEKVAIFKNEKEWTIINLIKMRQNRHFIVIDTDQRS
jgi:hypothetical protein